MPRASARKLSLSKALKAPPARAMQRFQVLQRAHPLLQEEHALPKKLLRIRQCMRFIQESAREPQQIS